MELTLIPIVAVLLLLSGSASTARLNGETASATSLLRRWFSTGERTSERPDAPCTTQRNHCAPADAAVAQASARKAIARKAAAVSTHLDRVRLHTRFGIASAAYRAAAPPLA